MLHGLVTGQRTQSIDKGLGVQQVPQFFRAALGERVLDLYRTAEIDDIFSAVVTLDAFPARIFCPVFCQCLNLLIASCHGEFLLESFPSGD